MNDAMSLGIHRLWKDQFVKRLNPRGGINCLDVAGGTGDIANRILDHARTQHGDRNTKVTILDINAKMLRAGQKRMRQTMYWNSPQLSFQLGNAEQLSSSVPPTFGDQSQQTQATNINAKLPPNSSPLPALPTIPIADNSVDLYTIAFGIRNCTHIDHVLSEAYRVLKPGGIFACLEFGKVNVPLLAQ
jgi:2-methoxy-6-polyprenyl-1,4-benzoquinol methylase